MTQPRRAVYRALIGGYEQLREEEVARDSDLRFICITDDPTLTSSTWEIVVHEPRRPLDHSRSARALKIIGHPLLEDFDETLWVDNTVALRRPPDELFDQWLGDADVAAPLHSYRSSVLAEAEAVIDAGLDDFSRVYEQLTHYLATGAGVLEENPHWTGMLARRRTPTIQAAMQAWWEDVLRYSRRDQISFLPVMRACDVDLRSVPMDCHASEWHEWPRATGRDPRGQGTGLREALRPPAGRIGELQQRVDEATHALAVTVSHRDGIIASLEASLSEANRRADDTLAELDQVRHQRNLTAEELTKTQQRLRRLKRRTTGRETRPIGWRRLLARVGRSRRRAPLR